MNKYVGVKQVLATLMTRQAYNDYRGWQLPADENGSDPGMLVEYIDGGASNHPNHAGYISWSPLEVFQKAYKPVDTPKERVAVERDELKQRAQALEKFLEAGQPSFISDEQWLLMDNQLDTMMRYLELLEMRYEIM